MIHSIKKESRVSDTRLISITREAHKPLAMRKNFVADFNLCDPQNSSGQTMADTLI